MNPFEIENLHERMEHFETVVNWMVEYWGDRRVSNRDFWVCWIKHSLTAGDVPSTYVVMSGGKLAATFSLWRCDLMSRQDLFPWFGGFVVDKAFRGKGLARQVIKQAVLMAGEMGYRTVYLNTEMKDYYEKSGFKYIGDYPDENGENVRVYRRSTDWRM